MISITTKDVGQFAGDMPLKGYNVQKHSVNAAILKMIPSAAVRSSITHFGTRGLFGKVTRRTAQHDKDNKRRKDWRGAQALKAKLDPYPMRKPKPKPRHRRSGGISKGNSRGQAVPGPPGREIVLDFRPHPLPSSSDVATSFPPPTHSTHDTLPTSADSSSRVLSFPGGRFSGTSVAYADSYSSPTGTVAHHPSIPSSMKHDVLANQDRRSLNMRPSPPTSTPSRYIVDATPTTQPVGGHRVVDASTSAPEFVGCANSQLYVNNLAAPHTYNVPIVDPSVDAHITESLYIRGRPAHEGTLCPTLDSDAASRGVPRPKYPFPTFAYPDSPSNRVPPLSNHFARPAGAHTWHGSQATAADPYAHKNGATLAPCYAMPTQISRSAPSIQDHTQTNEYRAPMWSSASHGREGPITSPPTTYHSPDPASWSHTSAFDQHRQSGGTSAHVSMIQSDEAVNALVNFYTQSPCAPYVDSELQPAYPVGSRGLICASKSAPEVAWQTIAESRVARIDGQTVNAFVGVGANASCQCAECVPRETRYAQGFEGDYDAHNPSWMHLIQVPQMEHVYVNYARGHGQWDDGPAYLNPPSSCFPPTMPPTPGPSLGQYLNHPYSL